MDDEQLGYIKGKVESLQYELSEFKEAHKEHMVKEEKDRERIIDKLDSISKEQQSIREELSIYKHVWWTVKAIAIGLVATLSMKLGDILTLFKGIK